jgi:hypothetical protein
MKQEKGDQKLLALACLNEHIGFQSPSGERNREASPVPAETKKQKNRLPMSFQEKQKRVTPRFCKSGEKVMMNGVSCEEDGVLCW